MTRGILVKLTEAFDLESFAAEETKRFPDIREGHWALDYIHTLQSAGVTRGYPYGTFRPENSITRTEFAALLARVILIVESHQENTEDDGEIEEETE